MKKVKTLLLVLVLSVAMCMSQIAFAASNYSSNYTPATPISDYYLNYTQGETITFTGNLEYEIDSMICGLVPDGTDINNLYLVGFSHYVVQNNQFVYLGNTTKTEKRIEPKSLYLFPGQYKYIDTTVTATLNTTNVLPGAYRFVVLMIYNNSRNLEYFYQDIGIGEKQNAIPGTSIISVDGVSKNFPVYTIDGSHYFKLEDVAYTLKGSAKQFNIIQNTQSGTMTLLRNQAYTAIGGEMLGKGTVPAVPVEAGARIILDSQEASLFSYIIDGNHYFKLQDIAQIFDFNVTLDNTNNPFTITTTQSYVSN